MIRLRLSHDPASVGFALSPLIEAIASLHVLLFPKAHAVQHPWIRAMHRVSPELKREIRAWAFLYEDAFPDCFIPPRIDETTTFDEHLNQLRSLSPEQARYDLARPLFHYHVPDAGGPERLGDRAVREGILAWARGAPGGGELAVLVLEEPGAALERLVSLFERYWEEAFAAEWDRLEPELEAAVVEGRETIDADGPLAMLAGQSELYLEDGAIVRRSPHEHTVEITVERRLMLIPSAYTWPHSRVNCDDPWPLLVLYPAPFVARQAALAPVPEPLVRTLKAVADTTRLRALRLIAERPRSTEELAPLVGLSEPALSRHLRALVEVGVLAPRRDGYYVLYELDRDSLERLPAELLDFLR